MDLEEKIDSGAEELIAHLPCKIKPKRFQVLGKWTMTDGGCMQYVLSDTMGMGKSITTLTNIFLRLGSDQKILVVGPQIVEETWPREFWRTCYNIGGVSRDAKVFRNSPINEDGSDPLTYGNVQLISMSYEALLNAVNFERIVNIVQGNDFVLVVDEVHNVNNVNTVRTRQMFRLRQYFRHVVLVSGTPQINALSNLSTVFILLGRGKAAYPSFWEGDFHREWVNRVTDEIGKYMIMRKKDYGNNDIVPMLRHHVSLPITPFQNWALEAMELERGARPNSKTGDKLCSSGEVSGDYSPSHATGSVIEMHASRTTLLSMTFLVPSVVHRILVPISPVGVEPIPHSALESTRDHCNHTVVCDCGMEGGACTCFLHDLDQRMLLEGYHLQNMVRGRTRTTARNRSLPPLGSFGLHVDLMGTGHKRERVQHRTIEYESGYSNQAERGVAVNVHSKESTEHATMSGGYESVEVSKLPPGVDVSVAFRPSVRDMCQWIYDILLTQSHVSNQSPGLDLNKEHQHHSHKMGVFNETCSHMLQDIPVRSAGVDYHPPSIYSVLQSSHTARYFFRGPLVYHMVRGEKVLLYLERVEAAMHLCVAIQKFYLNWYRRDLESELHQTVGDEGEELDTSGHPSSATRKPSGRGASRKIFSGDESPPVVYMFHGRLTPQERVETLGRFKSASAKKAPLLIFSKAGSVGTDILQASVVYISASSSYHMGNILQAENRNHRLGAEKLVRSIHMRPATIPSFSIMLLQYVKQWLTDQMMFQYGGDQTKAFPHQIHRCINAYEMITTLTKLRNLPDDVSLEPITEPKVGVGIASGGKPMTPEQLLVDNDVALVRYFRTLPKDAVFGFIIRLTHLAVERNQRTRGAANCVMGSVMKEIYRVDHDHSPRGGVDRRADQGDTGENTNVGGGEGGGGSVDRVVIQQNDVRKKKKKRKNSGWLKGQAKTVAQTSKDLLGQPKGTVGTQTVSENSVRRVRVESGIRGTTTNRSVQVTATRKKQKTPEQGCGPGVGTDKRRWNLGGAIEEGKYAQPHTRVERDPSSMCVRSRIGIVETCRVDVWKSDLRILDDYLQSAWEHVDSTSWTCNPPAMVVPAGIGYPLQVSATLLKQLHCEEDANLRQCLSMQDTCTHGQLTNLSTGVLRDVTFSTDANDGATIMDIAGSLRNIIGSIHNMIEQIFTELENGSKINTRLNYNYNSLDGPDITTRVLYRGAPPILSGTLAKSIMEILCPLAASCMYNKEAYERIANEKLEVLVNNIVKRKQRKIKGSFS